MPNKQKQNAASKSNQIAKIDPIVYYFLLGPNRKADEDASYKLTKRLCSEFKDFSQKWACVKG